MAWNVAQQDIYNKRRRIKFVDQVTVSHDAKTQQTALLFVEQFKNHGNKTILVTGDASNDTESIRDFTTDYIIIRETLKAHGWRVVVKVPPGNPNINNRVNVFNSLMEHHRCYFNSKCTGLILDLERNESDNKGGKNKTDPTQTHFSDAGDYLVWDLFAGEFKLLGVAK